MEEKSRDRRPGCMRHTSYLRAQLWQKCAGRSIQEAKFEPGAAARRADSVVYPSFGVMVLGRARPGRTGGSAKLTVHWHHCMTPLRKLVSLTSMAHRWLLWKLWSCRSRGGLGRSSCQVAPVTKISEILALQICAKSLLQKKCHSIFSG